MGHVVELTSDGETTVNAYKNAKRHGNPFDLVMLDRTVHTGLGGQETLHELVRFDPAVRAVVTTGYSNDPVLLEPEHYGFKAALAKPFSRDQLQKMLFRIMDNRHE